MGIRVRNRSRRWEKRDENWLAFEDSRFDRPGHNPIVSEGDWKAFDFAILGREGWELVWIDTERLQNSPLSWAGNRSSSEWYRKEFWFKRPALQES